MDLIPSSIRWTTRDALLYAVSVGATDQQRYVNDAAQGFSVLPLAPIAWLPRDPNTGDLPTSFNPNGLFDTLRNELGVEFDPDLLVHGEERTTIEVGKNKIPIKGESKVCGKILNIAQRSTGVTVEVAFRFDHPDVWVTSTSTIFLRKAKLTKKELPVSLTKKKDTAHTMMTTTTPTTT
eukprot:PhM_4_TR3472/c6_g1_i1/m.77868